MANRIWANSGALLSGLILGVSICPLVSMWGTAGKLGFGTLLEVIAGIMVCLLLATWKLVGLRSFVILLGSALLVVGTFFGLIAGGNVLSDMQRYRPYKEALATAPQFLHDCAPNEIRVVCFGFFGRDDGGTGEMTTWKVDLVTGSWSNAIISNRYQTMGNSSDLAHNPYTQLQIDQIKAWIAGLPSPRKKPFFFGSSFENKFHFAFYQGNTLQTCDYDKDEAVSQREWFIQIFQNPPHGS